VQHRVEVQVTMREFDAAVGLPGYVRIVGDHQNRMS
jgi:hypothetical protein